MREEGGTSRPLVAVLGASGMIGSAVTSALSQREAVVRAVARRVPDPPPGRHADVRTHRADLTRPGAVGRAVEGADAVIHLILDRGDWRGAGDGEAGRCVDVDVVRELIEALRGRPGAGPPPAVLFAGSTTQRGSTLGSGHVEPEGPVSAYDRRKDEAEALLREATSEGVVRAVPLRLPTVFGPSPGGDRGVVAAMVRRALANEPLTLWHDGAVRREFLYVDDVADAFLLALDHADSLAGRPWCLGSDRSERLGDVLGTVAALVAEHTGGDPVSVVRVPAPGHAQASDFTDMVVDSSAFRSVTGWRPRTPLDRALRRTVAAIAERGAPPPAGASV
ncbi:NAD-dependent epimerase/dehydratase family protein [Nocardiopsis deserti]|uniref:NAD-dependent epimerase/dehydratase family protein n=1 Tax=Nocardiopsis deserti TaxID=2605988 RepID=UPI001CC2407B|nr:NAD(P)-dependent oxidoreductase [Nocardiopsis deserti]